MRPSPFDLHYLPQVTLRYAEFATAILKLNRGYNDEILSSNLRRLMTEVNRTQCADLTRSF